MITSGHPDKVVFVVGTDTEVGKTWIARQLLQAWKSLGLKVSARKLAQSYAKGAWPTDADVLATASDELPEEVCLPKYWYPVEMAPPMAAIVLGMTPPTLAELVLSIGWPAGVDIGIVEAAGGVRSPQASDGDCIDLARLIDPQVIILVGHAGLGTINAIRMSHEALTGIKRADGQDIPIYAVLNHFEISSELHHYNLEWLRDKYSIEACTGIVDDVVKLATRLADYFGLLSTG